MSEAPIATIALTDAASRASRVLGFEPRALTPDEISQGLPGLKWSRLSGWEGLDDLVIANRIGLLAKQMQGNVLIVTEASFGAAKGAFVVDGSSLGTLIGAHLSRYGECFFNGDVIVIGLESGHVWLFHHEGAYAHVARD